MRIALLEVERPPVFQFERHGAVLHSGHFRRLAVDKAVGGVVLRPANAVALAKLEQVGAVHVDAAGSPGELPRIPVDQLAVVSDEVHRPGTAVDVVDLQFVALLDTEPLVGAVESHDAAGGVVVGQGFLGAGIAPGHEPCRFQCRSGDLTFANQPLADDVVDLVAKLVTGGDQPGVFALLGREPQPAGGGGACEVVRLDLGHVRPEFLERFLDVPAQAGLNRGFELGLALAHDLVHRRCFHARLL